MWVSESGLIFLIFELRYLKDSNTKKVERFYNLLTKAIILNKVQLGDFTSLVDKSVVFGGSVRSGFLWILFGDLLVKPLKYKVDSK